MSYALFGNFTVEAKDKETLASILQQAAEILQTNDDCMQYLVSDSGSETEVWVWEVWTDKQAHDDSLKNEELLALIMDAKPMITGMAPQTELTILGGKGLTSTD